MKHLALKQQKYQAAHLERKRIVLEREQTCLVSLHNQKLLHFCSNDYLNIAEDSRIKAAFAKAAHKHGLGSGSSALVAGYCNSHKELEERMAKFLKRERAILFNSGYHANL